MDIKSSGQKVGSLILDRFPVNRVRISQGMFSGTSVALFSACGYITACLTE